MELEFQAEDKAAQGPGLKRPREEEEEGALNGENNEESKKLKSDKSVEEERLEKATEEGEVENSGPIDLGPKKFGTSVEMFDYFYKFLHFWTPNFNVNKYERVMLLELLKKGHLEPDRKIGDGIRTFQVRYHPKYKSRCFFLIREDDSEDDFSFRKCVDHISPLPENMQVKNDVNKALGGGRGGRGGRGGGVGKGGCGRGGHWKGGKSRN
ncbi:OLC1v1012447C1 [Oldenlandia corymbosa var. corymbosa]|uniref:OLC1v1012447C1 n=1 Tax=Oldenlandia corymbosa var. corymbosa TaxID=529605 RepID=A0AAV1DYF7_OLDCO|nr:OLC1v1012447C1 [Oldenlandia corymbosa var. corymbosa]